MKGLYIKIIKWNYWNDRNGDKYKINSIFGAWYKQQKKVIFSILIKKYLAF